MSEKARGREGAAEAAADLCDGPALLSLPPLSLQILWRQTSSLFVPERYALLPEYARRCFNIHLIIQNTHEIL